MNLTLSVFKRISEKWIDIIIPLILFIIGIVVGMSYYSTFTEAGGEPFFGQRDFAAAVMLACGRGFVNIDVSQIPALFEFLLLQTDTFSCSTLPAILPISELNVTQRLYPYLMFTVASVWSLSKVSWNGLTSLHGVLFGLSVTLAYGIFRLGMGRLLAIIGASALIISTPHLHNLPHLRDYAKAPFILALILIIGWMVARPLKRRTFFSLSLAYGVILGIGFGFRNDLLINILPFVATLIFFLPGGIRANFRLKNIALFLFLISFLISAWPVFKGYSGGSNTGHVILLGLMSPFDHPLGLVSPLYGWGYIYLDGFASTLITNYVYRIHDQPELIYLSSEYDQAMFEYIFEIAKNFPADILIRVYGSILKILELPFAVNTYPPDVPFGVDHELLIRFYNWRIKVLNLLSGSGLWVIVLTLLMVSTHSLRKAIFLIIFVFYFAGLPAIQFQLRHFFYLELISWWALGFVIQQGISFIVKIARPGTAAKIFAQLRQGWITPVKHIAGLTLGVVIIIFVPLLVLRQYQQERVGNLLRTYLNAEKESLALTTTPLDDNQILLESSSLGPSTEQTAAVHAEYLVAEFSPEECDIIYLPVTFRYDAISEHKDYSKIVNLYNLPADMPTQIYFPAYYNQQISSFKGIEMSQAHAGCLNALYRVKDLKQFPLLLDLTFSSEWEQAKYFQTLAQWEEARWPDNGDQTIHTYPKDLSITERLLNTPLHQPEEGVAFLADVIRFVGTDQIIVQDQVDESSSPLLQTHSRELNKGSFFVARGELIQGGFTLGLFKNNQWVGQVNVVNKGKFIAVLQVPRDDVYSLVIANNLSGPSLRNSFIISEFGWIE